MLTPTQADKIIRRHLPKFGSQRIALLDACGAILDEEIRADRDMPGFDKALMDGIAIAYSAWKKGERTFQIQGTQSAGQNPKCLQSPHHCFEITTGSVIPHGCDTVVPVEQLTKKGDRHFFIEKKVPVTFFQNIQPQGSDQKKGALVLSKGARLYAPQIAIAASVGKSALKIKSKLKIAVIATGDELKPVSSKVTPYQTRLSNSYFIKTALDHIGLFDAKMFHIRDDEKLIFNTLKKLLNDCDILVLSGGVSKGKFDFVPGALHQLGVKKLVHHVSQKPGKPMWFGVSKNRVPVFALPGNPISTQVCLFRYVIPHLTEALGLNSGFQFVKLTEDVRIATNYTMFLPVQVCQTNDAVCLAKPIHFEYSGNLTRLGLTDGFVELKAGQKVFKKGTVVRLFRWN